MEPQRFQTNVTFCQARALNPLNSRVVQYIQLESIRVLNWRFDQPDVDPRTLLDGIDTSRFSFCRFVMPEVDLRET